jgi:hypothetical protein
MSKQYLCRYSVNIEPRGVRCAAQKTARNGAPRARAASSKACSAPAPREANALDYESSARPHVSRAFHETMRVIAPAMAHRALEPSPSAAGPAPLALAADSTGAGQAMSSRTAGTPVRSARFGHQQRRHEAPSGLRRSAMGAPSGHPEARSDSRPGYASAIGKCLEAPIGGLA